MGESGFRRRRRRLEDAAVRSRRDVQVPVRTSSFCSDGSCVGVAIGSDEVRVVDTKSEGVLSFTTREWAAFVAGVKAGEFDLP
ncbi:hypothetical protein GCM10023199_08880 [Actinomycetospora chibensis]